MFREVQEAVLMLQLCIHMWRRCMSQHLVLPSQMLRQRDDHHMQVQDVCLPQMQGLQSSDHPAKVQGVCLSQSQLHCQGLRISDHPAEVQDVCLPQKVSQWPHSPNHLAEVQELVSQLEYLTAKHPT